MRRALLFTGVKSCRRRFQVTDCSFYSEEVKQRQALFELLLNGKSDTLLIPKKFVLLQNYCIIEKL